MESFVDFHELSQHVCQDCVILFTAPSHTTVTRYTKPCEAESLRSSFKDPTQRKWATSVYYVYV